MCFEACLRWFGSILRLFSGGPGIAFRMHICFFVKRFLFYMIVGIFVFVLVSKCLIFLFCHVTSIVGRLVMYKLFLCRFVGSCFEAVLRLFQNCFYVVVRLL